jgi:methyl-accepting chemotaxis protein
MSDTKKIKRTQYVVDKSIQYRYAGLILLYTFIFFIISLAIIYFTGWKHLVEKLANVYPQAKLVEIFNAVYLRLLIGFLLLLPLSVISAILVSHKIAGPLVRVKKALRQMIDGDYNIFLRLRERDQLKDVADQINKLAASLKRKNV